MKDMKKRIVALILTVVMSLLTLASCGSFDFVEEDLTSYATFNKAEFLEKLQKLEIEDGEFTTDAATRAKLVAAKIYNVIVDKIIAETDEDEQVKSGNLTAGDVLYFVYYAVDADGNVFNGSDMAESTITSTSTAIKNRHVVRLADYLDGDGNELLKLIAENVNKDVDIADYLYSTKTIAEIAADAKEKLLETKADATDDEIKAAQKEALKLAAGDKIYVSYTRAHSETNAEGVTTLVTEKAAYEYITLDAENALHALLISDKASVDNDGKVTVDGGIKNTVDGVEYTYTNVKVLWHVESEGQPIASFKHTPYVDATGDTAKITPDSLYVSDSKVDLNNKELTYYVYPVYAIDAPANAEITAEDILYYAGGSSLNESSYDAFKDAYKNGDETVADLLEDVANIFATSKTDNEYYKEGTELKKLLDAYNKVGGANPTTEQKAENTEAKKALNDAQNAELKKVIAKLAAATLDGKKLGDAVLDEYTEDTEHTLKETYNSDIVSKVREAVLDLIYESVKVTSYPEKLLDEFVDHLYESYEYQFYTGDFDTTTSNYKKYGNLEAYLVATLKVSGADKIEEAIIKEAKSKIEPIIKIYVVAKALESDALAVMDDYVEADILGGAYDINEEQYKEAYGDEADKKIEEAKKNAEESIEKSREEASMFLIDDAYMRRYKKEVGGSYYRQLVEAYGEINLRTAIQFNKLFYYLTCTEIEIPEGEDHVEVKYTTDGTKIDFRTVDYVIVEAE